MDGIIQIPIIIWVSHEKISKGQGSTKNIIKNEDPISQYGYVSVRHTDQGPEKIESLF